MQKSDAFCAGICRSRCRSICFFVGVGVWAERAAYPARAHFITAIYLAEVVACGAGLAALWGSPLRERPGLVGAVVAAILSVLMAGYDANVGNVVERSAMAQVCLLTGLVVILPWSWRAQLAVAVTALSGFAVAVPHLVVNDTLSFSILAMLTGATTSVVGVRFLERYRRDAFLRAALLTEEAEVAAALADVAETLNANLNAPDMLERVNTLAAAALGCDWSATLLWDPRASGGAPAQRRRRARRAQSRGGVARVLVRRASDHGGAALQRVDRDRRLRAPEPGADRVVSPLRHRVRALRADLARGGVLGVLAHGYTDRTGTFSAKQRRIALGISHATAIAMQNARLISDLQAASELKSEFVSTMSHELRTPLNVISGYTDMLADGAFDPLTPSQHDTVLRVRRSALELLELVNATLDLIASRPGATPSSPRRSMPVALFAELGRELEALVAGRGGPALAQRAGGRAGRERPREAEDHSEEPGRQRAQVHPTVASSR